MYNIDDIKKVHLEISSRCNASCPMCPRNFHGYPHNDGYPEHDMTLDEAKKIFAPDFIGQLDEIFINGNFGDAVMNPETVDIVQYFRSHNENLIISISTNAGARDRKFWEYLAQLKIEIVFCIDGLADTHSLYRQNTLYTTVIKNAQTFIKAGGQAVWKMIDFDFNEHQRDEAKQLSKLLGFNSFQLIKSQRKNTPVYDKNQNLTHTVGNPKYTEFSVLWKKRTTDEVLLEGIVKHKTEKPISCKVKQQKSIYISSTGDVFPCCFLGFSPKTYGHGNYHQAANKQFSNMIQQNNALEYSLIECMQWFDSIVQTWNIPKFEHGRLVICNDVCGIG